MMKEKVYQITCTPECGFMVKSHYEKETLKMGMMHAKEKHGMKNVTESETRKMMKVV